MTHEALIDLLKSMTLEEKAGQLAQVAISTCIGGISQPTGPMEAYSLTPEMLKYCGSLICDSPGDAENSASAIRSVMEAHPHHIPPRRYEGYHSWLPNCVPDSSGDRQQL